MKSYSALDYRILLIFTVVATSFGCASAHNANRSESSLQNFAPAPTERVVVRSGDLVISVESLDETSLEVERLITESGGFVERSNATQDSNVWLRCRVPASQLDPVMDAISSLGSEKRRSVSAADVTEQYTDLQTRLRNNIALRERLQALLKRASDVEDVLSIERELNRIQSEIESMQARFDRLKSEVELSALSITLQRKQILGPLGYVGYGIWWAFSKLFVIR
jgi:hypothetical protein